MNDDIHRHSDLSYGGEECVMKPQLIQNLHNQEWVQLSTIQQEGRTNQHWEFFYFNDSFFIKCTIKVQ